MISEEEARAKILDRVDSGGVEEIRTGEALGRILAREYRADFSSPAFDNSAMDGYAVRWLDGADVGKELTIGGEQPAGVDRGLVLEAGQAIRVFTGAPLPEGTSAVIMQEDVEVEEGLIRVLEPVAPGEHIRKAGADFCEGQLIGGRGEVLTPQQIALLSSQGHAAVLVGKRPILEVLTTGDEVREAGVLRSGEIYNSNGPMLEALAMRSGVTEVTRQHARDVEAQIGEQIRGALDRSDFLVIAGGVSVGERDLVKEALVAQGVTIEFWGVAVKPGKPMLFGYREEGGSGSRRCFVFGLPGNPVSGFVCWHLFVDSALRRWMGAARCEPATLMCPLGEAVANPGDRPHYVRGEFDPGQPVFHPLGMQQSHALFGLSRANAIARIAPGVHHAPGHPVPVIRIS